MYVLLVFTIFRILFYQVVRGERVIGDTATVLDVLWALEWAWHPAETSLRCAEISGIPVL